MSRIATADDWNKFAEAMRSSQPKSSRVATTEDWTKFVQAYRTQQVKNEYDADYTNYTSALGKVDKGWLSPTDMQGVFDTVDAFAKKYKVDAAEYKKLSDRLIEVRDLYSKFENAEEYKNASLAYKYQGLTYKQVQGLLPSVTDPEERKFLENYGTTVGYGDMESYDEELAAIDYEMGAAGRAVKYWNENFADGQKYDYRKNLSPEDAAFANLMGWGTEQGEQYAREEAKKAVDELFLNPSEEQLARAKLLEEKRVALEERKFLEKYGLTFGYGDVASYDEEIAKIDYENGAAERAVKYWNENFAGGQKYDYRKNLSPEEAAFANLMGWGTEQGEQYARESAEKDLNDYFLNPSEDKKLRSQQLAVKRKALVEARDNLVLSLKYEPYRNNADFAEKSKWSDDGGSAVGNLSAFFSDNMKPEEKEMYTYLCNTEGETAGDAYLDELKPLLNYRKNRSQQEAYAEFAKKVPVISDAVTVVSNLASPFVFATQIFATMTGTYDDNWATIEAPITFTNTVRGTRATQLGDLGGKIYQIGMGMADMLAAIAVSKGVGAAFSGGSAATATAITKTATQAIMGSSAASQTMASARARGLDDFSIILEGLGAFAIEYFTEKIGLDELLGEQTTFWSAVKQNAKTETLEEGLATALNTAWDNTVAADKSEINTRIWELVLKEDLDYKVAAKRVLGEKSRDLAWDMIGGLVSGGALGGGRYALTKAFGVLYSAPSKFDGDLKGTQKWVQNAFGKLKKTVDVKGVGTIQIESESMMDAITKTNTESQAVTFAAIVSVLKKGKWTKIENGNVVKFSSLSELNGETHLITISAQKTQSGDYVVTYVIVDDTIVYDLKAYQDGAQSEQIGENEMSVESDTAFDGATVDGSSKVWHNPNQENIQKGEIYDGDNNAELLARRTIPTVNRSGNSIRERGENSGKISSFVEKLFIRQGKSIQGLRAGDSGWLVPQADQESKIRNRFESSIRRKISRITLSGFDTIGRKIDDGLKQKFKDTVFKDENGNLLSLYHWTQATFDLFAKGEFGFHFGTLDAAHNRYTQSVGEGQNDQGGCYKEVYLNITNPYIIPFDAGVWCAHPVAYQLKEDGVISEQEYDTLAMDESFWDNTYDNSASKAVRSLLNQKGYDGIIYKNESEDAGSYSVIALYPDQILTVAENGVLKEGNGVSEAPINGINDDVNLPPSDGGTGSIAVAKNPELSKSNASALPSDIGGIGRTASALDRTFMSMSETERTSLIAAFEKNTGTRVVFDETLDTDGAYENGVIYINPNTATPMTVIKHELTHHLEQSGSYADFMNFVFEQCDSFRTWLQSKGSSDVAQYAQTIIESREAAGHPLGQNGVAAEYEAQQEILADFCGEMLFRDTNALSELAQKNRNLFQRIWDWVKSLFTKYEGTAMEQELREIEQRFAQVVQKSKNADSTETDTVRKHSVPTLTDPADQSNVDNPGEISYNNWESYELTDEFVAKVPFDERHAFLRSLANKTSELKQGEHKNIVIFTDKHVYFYAATGYMNGSIEEGVTLGSKKTNAKIKAWRDISGSSDAGTATPDSMAQSYGRRRRRNDWDNADNGYAQETGRLDDVDEQTQESDPFGYNWESNGNFQEDEELIPGSLVYADDGRVLKVNDDNTVEEVPFSDIDAEQANMSPDLESPPSQDGAGFFHAQNGKKYSVPTLTDPTETVDGAEADTETDEPDTRSRLEQFSDEEIRKELQRRHPKDGIGKIATLKPEDAITVTAFEGSGVRNRKGDGESAFAESLQGADIFDDRLKELAATNSTIARYDRIANKDTLEEANKALNEGGAEFVEQWKKKPTNSFTAKDVAVGFILMSRYQTVGDYSSEVTVAEKLREVGTLSGQAVQLFSILGRMTPEGMLLYAQRELNSAYEHLVKGKTNKWVEDHKAQFKLTDEDAEIIRRRVWQAAQLPDGRDKNILLAEVSSRVKEKIPPEKGQAYKAWQRTAMLLNPKTQIRNVLGNATMVPAFVVSDLFGTAIDATLGKVTGVRTTSITGLSGKAFKQGLFESWDDFVRDINTRDIQADRFEISGRSDKNFNEHHTGFAADARNNLSRALNALDRFNSFLLEAGDRSFYQMWFVNSLNSQMKAKKITDRSQITPEMIEIATQEALQRTWQDTNKMTKAVSRVKDAMNTLQVNGYGLGDVVIKFVKTPANLTKAMFDFSPAGFAKALSVDAVRFATAVREGRVTPQMQRVFVKNLSNGITGTILMVIGAALAQAGWITGEKDEDKDVASFERYVRGYQPYSFKIGNASLSYDWMMPIASSWAMMANHFDGKRVGEEKPLYQDVVDAIKTGGQVLFDQSFMRSLQTLFSEDDILSSVLGSILSDVTAPIPQMLSQAAASLDPIVRNTYEHDDDLQMAWNKVISRIPGLRQTLAPSVDVMGNEIKQVDNGLLRTIVSFFSPANVGKGYESKAADEVYRLYKATGERSVIPPQAPNYVTTSDGKVTLGSREKAEYQKTSGKIAADAVDGFVDNAQYRALDDDDKIALVEDVYAYAKQVANNEVLSLDMNEASAKAHRAISQGVSAHEYFLIRKTADANGNGSISQDEARAILDASNLTKEQKSIMWSAFNSTWKYNPYGKRYY